MNIKLLDCTLRDGGLGLEDNSHYSDTPISFNNSIKKEIQKLLVSSRIDLIELGSLQEKSDEYRDYAIYDNIESISELIKDEKEKDRFVALFRGPDTDLNAIPVWNDNLIKNIRVIIRYSELEKSIDFCKNLAMKGYNTFIQPMVTMRYTEEQIDYMIAAANAMNAYALYFVDSYGYMTYNDIEYIFEKYNKKLNQRIYIGFHAHNNLNLAFSNVVHFIELAKKFDRNIIVDSTCTGMGQGAGNIQTELLIAQKQSDFKVEYNMLSVLDICEIVERLNGSFTWGYSPLYMIPANNKTAYKFAVCLRKKYGFTYKEIYKILSNIPDDIVHRFSNDNLKKLLELNGYQI